MVDLKKRIIEIAYKNKLSHLGSYLSSVEIIDKIYEKKNKEDIFILSSGHAALALYVVIEKYKGIDAEYLFNKHGGHPHRDEENDIYCSTGSLGMGITVAVGRAMADKNKKVYVLISDGECAEGSVWEALRYIQESNLSNIEVHVNVNGYAAYDKIDTKYLVDRLKTFLPRVNIEYTSVNQLPCLKGLNAHYHIMSETDYKKAKASL
jgi:transketolase|tara:strand:- start:50 stop:670 length:621 start_codon:yes stop_codon:yes gene_type:complete